MEDQNEQQVSCLDRFDLASVHIRKKEKKKR
jgi:hypothetical protein